MIIIDASIAGKFILHEEQYLEVRGIFEKHLQKTEEILVPDLIFYEITNALATKSAIHINKVIKSINQLYKYDLNIYHPTKMDMNKAARFAKKYSVSVYDAIYAVLAKEKRCNLITADEKFVNQVKLSFVKFYLGSSKEFKKEL